MRNQSGVYSLAKVVLSCYCGLALNDRQSYSAKLTLSNRVILEGHHGLRLRQWIMMRAVTSFVKWNACVGTSAGPTARRLRKPILACSQNISLQTPVQPGGCAGFYLRVLFKTVSPLFHSHSSKREREGMIRQGAEMDINRQGLMQPWTRSCTERGFFCFFLKDTLRARVIYSIIKTPSAIMEIEWRLLMMMTTMAGEQHLF